MALEALPTHLPLPTKLRNEILDPIELDHDTERTKDDEYADDIYGEVEWTLQDGVNRLAERRRFPVFG